MRSCQDTRSDRRGRTLGWLAPLMVAGVVAATSCGSADTTSSSTTPAAAPTSVSLAVVVTAALDITDRIGGEAGFVATIRALDRGYSIGQVLDHHVDLMPSGSIEVGDAPVSPTGVPLGLVGPVPIDDDASSGRSAQPVGFRRVDVADDEYLAFVDATLSELWLRMHVRAQGVDGSKADKMVDAWFDERLARQRAEAELDAELDALYASDPDPLDGLTESEAYATHLVMTLVASGYSLEDALAAGLSGSFVWTGSCLAIPGATRVTPDVLLFGCDLFDEVPGDDTADAADEQPGVAVDVTAAGHQQTEASIVETALADPTLIESGTTEWSGDLVPRTDLPATAWERPLTYLGGAVLITREPGTDLFEITAAFDTDGWTKWALSDEAFLELGTFDPNWCPTATSRVFEGLGRIAVDEFGEVSIVFGGVETTTQEFTGCTLEQLPPTVNELAIEVWVEVDSNGLNGTFQGHDFVLPGVALPVAYG